MNKLSLIAVLGIAAVAAHATDLNFHGMVGGKSKAVKIRYNGDTMNVVAGAMNIDIDGGPNFEAYCVDLDHWNSGGMSYGVDIQGINTLNNAQMIRNLWENHALSINSKNEGAAFQLAIWDAMVDGGDGVSSGNFRAYNLSSGLQSKLNFYQNSYNTPGTTQFDFSVFKATSHGSSCEKYQDLMTGSPVPEPATMVGIALAGLAVLKRRKSNKK